MAHPTFLIIGAMKAGTSSLYQYVRSHPDVYMSQVKELDFFSIDRFWRKGWDWYTQQFSKATDGQAIGEASTSYTKYPHIEGVPERIAQYLPDVRLVYVIRDPIARIRSHYEHEVALGREKAPLDEAVLRDTRYIDLSRYALQIEQYLDHFPPSQLLIVQAENLRSRHEETLATVFRFIGVDAGWAASVSDSEYYTAEQRLTYPGPFVSLLRLMMQRTPGLVTKLASVTPSPLKRLMGQPVREITSSTSVMSESRRAQVVDQLRDDLERLPKYVEGDFDGWGLI